MILANRVSFGWRGRCGFDALYLRRWFCSYGAAYHKADGKGQGGGIDGTDNQGAVKALFGLMGGLLVGISQGVSAEASEL